MPFLLTQAMLHAAMPTATAPHVALYLDPLNKTMAKHNINTPLRAAHFLAQVSHESGDLRWVTELASGAIYEGRRDLGNIEPGDGVRFKGRGLIQLTGRVNYEAFGKAEGINVVLDPGLVANDPVLAAESAGWFWETHGLNAIADADNGLRASEIVNGGTIGISARLLAIKECKAALGCDVIVGQIPT